MNLYLPSYIQKVLKTAEYEYDPSVKRWVGWISGVPGVFAQSKTIEQTRQELASALEAYILIALKRGGRLHGFVLPQKRSYAEAR